MSASVATPPPLQRPSAAKQRRSPNAVAAAPGSGASRSAHELDTPVEFTAEALRFAVAALHAANSEQIFHQKRAQIKTRMRTSGLFREPGADDVLTLASPRHRQPEDRYPQKE